MRKPFVYQFFKDWSQSERAPNSPKITPNMTLDEIEPIYQTGIVQWATQNPEDADDAGLCLSGENNLTVHAHSPNSFMLVWLATKERLFYKIGEDFGKVLEEADLSFKTKHISGIPNGFFIIQLPFCVKMFTKKEVQAMALLVHKTDDVILITVPCLNEHGRVGRSCTFGFDFREHPPENTFQENWEANVRSGYMEKTSATSEIMAYAIKAIMYIHSGNPDLREYKPLPTGKELPRKERDRNLQLNEHGNHNLTLVGFDWKKTKEYSVGQSQVRGHWRWTPCGPQRSQVKLNWIAEHVSPKIPRVVITRRRKEEKT